MKSFKLLAAGLLAATAVGIASAAPTYVKITGSTAFRKANIVAIVKSLNSPKGAFADTTGSTTTDVTGKVRLVIRGTLKSGPSVGQDVVYQLALAGSVGGVAGVDADQGLVPGAAFDATHSWMKDDSQGGTLTPITESGGVVTGLTCLVDNPTNSAAGFEAWTQPDATFSDSLQGSTPYTSTTLTEALGGPVGVIDFYWVKGASYAGNSAKYNLLTNITQQQASVLQKNGIVSLSQFTGNIADSGVDVVVVGRNSDSGTRLAAEAEAQAGFQLIFPTLYRAVSAASGITADWSAFPEQGYDSGGKVAADLRVGFSTGVVDDNGKPFILVGYVGKSDKNTAIASNVAAVLAYNGVTPTDAAINNGQYTFWTYQHTYHRLGAGVAKNAIDLQAAQVRTTDFTYSGLSISSMGGYSRDFEGATVTK